MRSPAFSAQFISVGLAADFATHLTADIAAFETAIGTKGTGQQTESGATSGLEDTAHKAANALHVLNTVVRNKYKSDPVKLGEWTTASHIEKHTPVPRPKKTEPTPPAK